MFSSLTKPNYPSSALGIEAGSISVVALSGKPGNFSVKQAATIELPPGLITPSFLDQNIRDDAEFSSCLIEAVESAGLLKQKRWSVTLPSTTARTAILALDNEPASSKEAAEIIDWKAEQTFGCPAIELRLTRKKISPDRDRRARYFATAIRLSVIDEYETHFERLGWKAGLILPRAMGEANWLLGRKDANDSLLISENADGFTALLLRGGEPAVVRSVTCGITEIDDEIYRLVMFYNDRFGSHGGDSLLERLLVVGKNLIPATVQHIASEALGRKLKVMTPADIGFDFPANFRFNDLAAPAGLAALKS